MTAQPPAPQGAPARGEDLRIVNGYLEPAPVPIEKMADAELGELIGLGKGLELYAKGETAQANIRSEREKYEAELERRVAEREAQEAEPDVEAYATGFMCGLEDQGFSFTPDLENAILDAVEDLLDRVLPQSKAEAAEAAEAELERLREVERRHRALGSELGESLWGEGRSLDDYGDLFDLLEAHGVIAKHPEPYDPVKHGHVHEDVAPGDEWYQLAWKIEPQPQDATAGEGGDRV